MSVGSEKQSLSMCFDMPFLLLGVGCSGNPFLQSRQCTPSAYCYKETRMINKDSISLKKYTLYGKAIYTAKKKNLKRVPIIHERTQLEKKTE